jgi:hypothetical protein
MAELAERLATLGFNLVFAGDGALVRKRWLSHAVREFQIYASMPRVAKDKPPPPAGPQSPRWLDRLEAVGNAHIYAGPKDGDEKAPGFLACVEAWEAQRYRCPVVVDVFVLDKKGALVQLDGCGGWFGNYWRYDDPRIEAFVGGEKTRKERVKRLRFRVCDLTGLFRSAHDPAPNDMEIIGGMSIFKKYWRGGLGHNGGDDNEITPQTLLGIDWSQIRTAETKSTFRVLRAISEFEASGRFDGLNGYDDANISIGPFNWALAPSGLLENVKPDPEAAANVGELAPYLAYWAGREPVDSNAKLFDPFGIMVKPAWPAGKAGPKLPSWASSRNYVGRLDWAPLDSKTEPTANPGKKYFSDLEWLRTTHWFWRWLALSRHVQSFRRRQWDLGRVRVRDVLAFEIDPSDRVGKPVGAKKVRLDQMFTSEVAVAILVRCHVRFSNFLSQNNFRRPSLRLALALANLPLDVSKWKETEQNQLIEGMIAACAFMGITSAEKKKLQGQADKLHEHRYWLASRDRNKSNELYQNCGELSMWPIAEKFRWNFPKRPPPGKYALPQSACEPALSWKPNSFKLDDAGLPPIP